MPRKILQIIPEIATGGAERIVFETAKAITQSAVSYTHLDVYKRQ